MLQYRVWKDGGLWHWEVMTRHGVRIHHGACDDWVNSRVEAVLVATRPETAAVVEDLEHDQFVLCMHASEQALRHSLGWSDLLFRDTLAFARSYEVSKALASKSRAAIRESRQMLGEPTNPLIGGQ